MNFIETWSWSLDGWIILAGILCSVAAALPGSFLVLRRMSLLGDAISHAVLPGLALAFLISGSRSSVPMFLGAVVAGLATALFTEWIRGVGEVDEGASMGVVFTSLFAVGLILIVQAADRVDLDPGCVLYGAIELTPLDLVSVFGVDVPRAVLMLGGVAVMNVLFVVVFFKELKICSFDPDLATALGFHARAMHYALMVVIAVTAVASFESVGNILVVAMFIVPPAAARLLTDRLGRMIFIAALLAAVSAVTGHIAALEIPRWFGFQSTTTAGMMAVCVGVLFLLTVIFSPRQGVAVRFVRQKYLSLKILADDVCSLLYRIQERGFTTRATQTALRRILLAGPVSLWLVLVWLRLRGFVSRQNGEFRLAETGQQRARRLVRAHRLWELYLQSHADVGEGQLHDKAEQFEHFTGSELRTQLSAATNQPDVDPHGRPIPDEGGADA